MRIEPPAGVTVDPKRRRYLIIDPRAGHPVYFVIFFRDPEPDQTMLDACTAEQRFVHKVRELHPDSPKPAFDLRANRSPIVLFASMGDNITPPQQAFNWVAGLYGSSEEIKVHRARAMEKMGVGTLAELVRKTLEVELGTLIDGKGAHRDGRMA